VLKGAPAISMALNRRARVQVAETGDSAHVVSAPGYLSGSFHFSLDSDRSIRWIDELPDSDALALFEAVWRQSGITKEAGWSFVLDTSEFFDAASGSKLGLGSSAALATALAAALIAAESLSCSTMSLAADAHRNFQSGAGSGIDIATSIHGGLIEYQIGQTPNPLRWPENLFYRILWSGQVASTKAKLSRNSEAADFREGDALGDASRDVTIAWQSAKSALLLSKMARYIDELKAYSIDHELGIFEAGHQELSEMAETYPNTVYKPCGAGGGDIGIVLAQSMREVDRFTAAAKRSGFTSLDATLDSDGVLVEGGPLC
jgi:phosphomevalonate kinase